MAEAIPFRLFTGYKGCVYHIIVNIVAPIQNGGMNITMTIT